MLSSSVVGFHSRYRLCSFPMLSSPLRVSIIVLSFVSCVLCSVRSFMYASLLSMVFVVSGVLFSSMSFAVFARSLNSLLMASGVPLPVASVAFTRFRFFMVVVWLWLNVWLAGAVCGRLLLLAWLCYIRFSVFW